MKDKFGELVTCIIIIVPVLGILTIVYTIELAFAVKLFGMITGWW